MIAWLAYGPWAQALQVFWPQGAGLCSEGRAPAPLAAAT